jgi:hypothetical protein
MGTGRMADDGIVALVTKGLMAEDSQPQCRHGNGEK